MGGERKMQKKQSELPAPPELPTDCMAYELEKEGPSFQYKDTAILRKKVMSTPLYTLPREMRGSSMSNNTSQNTFKRSNNTSHNTSNRESMRHISHYKHINHVRPPSLI